MSFTKTTKHKHGKYVANKHGSTHKHKDNVPQELLHSWEHNSLPMVLRPPNCKGCFNAPGGKDLLYCLATVIRRNNNLAVTAKPAAIMQNQWYCSNNPLTFSVAQARCATLLNTVWQMLAHSSPVSSPPPHPTTNKNAIHSTTGGTYKEYVQSVIVYI